uniref:Uncharacterized protein n=1 Tax=Pseudonaja textilis TaxID=8673 RepID=A0A670Z9A5_PSETE
MSRLLRAFTEMIEGNSKVAPRKSTDAEPLKKSEFKTLIQKELTTSKGPEEGCHAISKKQKFCRKSWIFSKRGISLG